MKNSILILFFLLLAVACQESSQLSEIEREQVKQEVKLTLENYYRDIRESGLNAEFKYLDSSSDFFWVPPGYEGPVAYDGIAKAIRQNALLFKSLDNSFDTLLIVPMGKEMAAYTGRISSAMTDTSGKVSTVKLLETGVMIKRKDGWKLLSGQTSVRGE